ncbi:MAG: GntR family transcriptional regulator [Firmicutes bacterium]|nr:GntR family transcriptional regulator [Bacillota bacterium]
MMISRDNRLPLYFQLKQAIQERVDDGGLKPGDKIPTEAELQGSYGLSRTTVRLALRELELEGVLTRVQGKGTFVAEPKIQLLPRNLMSFTEEMQSASLDPGRVVLSLTRQLPSKRVSGLLLLQAGEMVHRVEQVRTGNGEPIGLHVGYLPVKYVPELSEEILRERSLYEYLESHVGLRFAGATERVEATLADGRQAEVLGVAKGAPLLLINRVTYLSNGAPGELVMMYNRADRYAYTSILGPRLRVR